MKSKVPYVLTLPYITLLYDYRKVYHPEIIPVKYKKNYIPYLTLLYPLNTTPHLREHDINIH